MSINKKDMLFTNCFCSIVYCQDHSINTVTGDITLQIIDWSLIGEINDSVL